MPRNGSGGYDLPQPAFVNATVIDPAPVNSDFNDIAAALTGSVASDGQTPMTGTLNLGTNAIVGGTTGFFTGVMTAANIGRGAVAVRTTTQSIPNNTETAVTFEAASINDNSFWSGASPTRLTVPGGVTRVLVSAQVIWGNANVGTRKLRVLMNGVAEGYGLPAVQAINSGAGYNVIMNGAGGLYPVSAGDYFQLFVYQDCGSPLNMLGGGNTWFSIQLMG